MTITAKPYGSKTARIEELEAENAKLKSIIANARARTLAASAPAPARDPITKEDDRNATGETLPPPAKSEPTLFSRYEKMPTGPDRTAFFQQNMHALYSQMTTKAKAANA